jgi:hypothetical protein
MFKRMTFEEITNVKNPLMHTLADLMKKQRVPHFKKFLRQHQPLAHQVIYFARNRPSIIIGSHE